MADGLAHETNNYINFMQVLKNESWATYQMSFKRYQTGNSDGANATLLGNVKADSSWKST